jgi:uncharacterized protein involved in outer membrane biogenesis
MNKWIKRLALGLLITVAMLAIAISFIGGFLIKQTVNTAGPRLLGVPLHLNSATLYPFRGYVALKGLHIGNPKGFKAESLFDMAALDIRLRMRSLLTNRVIVESINISGPELTYERNLKTSNIDRLMTMLAPEKPAPAAEAKLAKKAPPGRKVIIKELSVNGTRVHVALTALGGHGFILPLPPIHLSNIGGNENGVTFAEAVREVLAAIFTSVGDAVTGSGKLLGTGASEVEKAAGKAIEGVKNLLN